PGSMERFRIRAFSMDPGVCRDDGKSIFRTTMNDKTEYGFTTTILHNDRRKPIEQNSLHKPIHTSVAFGYTDARQLASVFQGKEPGFRYGRQGNPTVSALEDKVSKMEDGVATLCFATGMAAIGALAQALLK